MAVETGQRTEQVEPAAFTSGVRTWVTEKNETVYACGCRVLTNVTPHALQIWCGQPDCIRLAQAGIAFDARQYAWQKSRGGDPEMVEGLVRHMRTPLPQTVPPPTNPLDPPGVIPFGYDSAPKEEEEEEQPQPVPGPARTPERPQPPHKPPEEPPKKK